MQDEKIDERIYLSIISDIKNEWKDGDKMEYLAMDYIVKKIYERFCINNNEVKGCMKLI